MYLHRQIKIYVQDPIVMKKDDDNRSFLKVSCHTKFRFAEREAQCILGECGPLSIIKSRCSLNLKAYTCKVSVGKGLYKSKLISVF